jgi:hypothetical protein
MHGVRPVNPAEARGGGREPARPGSEDAGHGT